MDMDAINRRVIEDFRAGREIGVKGMHRERICLLTTTGRTSGERHIAPMMFIRSDRGVLVIASNNGSPRDPQWYLNLEADPAVHVELPDGPEGTEEWDGTAEVAYGERREQLWSRITDAFPFFVDHQAGVEREIPVVELVRA